MKATKAKWGKMIISTHFHGFKLRLWFRVKVITWIMYGVEYSHRGCRKYASANNSCVFLLNYRFPNEAFS